MRVAFLVSRFSKSAGGAEESSRRLVNELATHHGVEFLVLTRNQPGPEFENRRVVVRKSPLANVGARWIASSSYIGSSLLDIATRGPFDVFHAVQLYSPTTIAAIAGRIRRGRVIVKVTASGLIGETAELRRLPFLRVRRSLLSRVDRFVALTATMRDELAEFGLPHEKIRVIPNGVPIPDLSSPARNVRAELGIDDSAPVVGFVGRLSSEKGLELLLHAWPQVLSKVPDARLLLVGGGGSVRNVEADLKAQASASGIAHTITFVGHVPEVSPFLRAMDAFILPSRSEGMSNSLLEAMAHAKAIAASAIPANKEVIADDESGLLFELAPDSLSTAIVRLLDDDGLRQRLGHTAREIASRRYSVASVAATYLALYRETA